MSDEFYKAPDNKYYKSVEIYQADRRQKQLWNEIIRFICIELLKYDDKCVFPSLITRKLNEYKNYDREVILKTLHEIKGSVEYQFNQDGKFKDDTAKIFYLFAVIGNKINDVNKEYDRDKKELEQKVKIEENVDMNFKTGNLQNIAKDMSSWLDD